MRWETESVWKAKEMWREQREEVDRLEKAADEDPIRTLEDQTSFAVQQIVRSRRLLSARFGLDVRVGDLGEVAWINTLNARVDLDDAEEVGELIDTLWRFATYEDGRVEINRAIAMAVERGDSSEQAARAACGALIHVLRSRPLLYGIFAFAPDLFDREPSGLREVRAAATVVLAGWVRAHLTLKDWEQPSGKRGENRLRKALEEMAGPDGSIERVFLRELPAETFARLEELIRVAEEIEPEQASGAFEHGHNTLRNRVSTSLEGRISDEEKLRRKGKYVASQEAETERVLLAHQQLSGTSECLDTLEALAMLSPQQRRIIQLVREGESNSAIASKEATTTGNVEKQKSVALAKMRQARQAAGY